MIRKDLLEKLKADYILQNKIIEKSGKSLWTVQRWIAAAQKDEKSGLTDASIISILQEHFKLPYEKIIIK